jgi:hypothetical protein
MTGSVVMSEKTHQRTSEQKQIGCSGKSVACMGCQQVHAERRRDKSYSQPGLRAEKTSESGHGDSGHRSSSVVIVPSRDQVALRQIK